VTRKYPELLEVPTNRDIILDGELICYVPETSRVDFERCMERFITRMKGKAGLIPAYYVVFDILFYDGEDLRNRPLHER
jgi:DNA ligase 1